MEGREGWKHNIKSLQLTLCTELRIRTDYLGTYFVPCRTLNIVGPLASFFLAVSIRGASARYLPPMQVLDRYIGRRGVNHLNQ